MAESSSKGASAADHSTVRCEQCGSEVADPSSWLHDPDQQRQPCATCGAVGHWIAEVFVSETAHAYEFVERKGTVQGKKKPRSEIQVGDQLAVTAGRYIKKRRVIDRDADWYEEIVVDPETGNVLHSCAEPLSDHFGHGSDKASE